MNKNIMINQKIIDYVFIILIIIYVSTYILISSFSETNGFITGDSANYLRLSERILGGHGFFNPPNGRQEAVDEWFALWPIGYPMLISSIAWILGVSTFLASKILNILLLSSSILLLYFNLGRSGLIVSLMLLTAGTLRNYTMTWSEAPFLTALIVLCLYLGKILNGNIKVNNRNFFFLSILMILPFLFRYIGIFVIAPTFLIAINLIFQGRKRESILTLLSIFFTIIFALIYFINNFYLTGYSTGMIRTSVPYEDYYALLNNLIFGIIREFVLILPYWDPTNFKQNIIVIVWLVIVLFSIFLFSRNIPKLKLKDFNISFSYVFMIFGFAYLIAFIFVSFNAYFNKFSPRLLDPGFSLFFIGLGLWVLKKNIIKNVSLVIFVLITFLLVAAGQFYAIKTKYASGVSYLNYIQKMQIKYEKLPDNAIVIFGKKELKYLRPNIRFAGPNINETWEEFLSNLDTSLPIFIETGTRHRDLSSFHKSIENTVMKLPLNSVVPIKKSTK